MLDAGVGVRAVQHFGHQHAALLDIGGKGRLALHQLDRIHLGLRLAHSLPGPGLRDDLNARQHLRRRQDLPARWEVWRTFENRRAFSRSRLSRQPLLPAEGAPVDRPNRLAAQHRRGPQHRLHRLQITRTAAQDSRKRLAHLTFSGVWVALEQLLGCQDHRRRAVTALDGAGLHEGLLERV
jgi:hypothetical protein